MYGMNSSFGFGFRITIYVKTEFCEFQYKRTEQSNGATFKVASTSKENLRRYRDIRYILIRNLLYIILPV
ncbi:hypothetical protein BpHYR1_052210 [Brachionus plicatilis]|uniref:Uncharacterized protein n=1 Tax=Brachionus plicatilis TaxID=10195 RepID=A0A3M7SGT5_BRAPC|nr:hypothetical protein BpHYR1_052210 [Brachionus plicatilis]